MIGDGGVAYVLDGTTGNVAACKANGATMTCTRMIRLLEP
jgi:hypothetical protein